ncbi:MAG: lactate utilization protein C [Desulfobacterales bacterium CG07_land_8_20_14_0_80_52_14]|nr:MAG: lactate utilization protein C [Desulfobacterales bacterium CG23_combo_of_CG06-09_8_20_14_all_52_9]PIU50431.1 MAG: lactate utilization protein C [Desulfobacterales bacterium CG07_land_8_20_14_0_80_52_14]
MSTPDQEYFLRRIRRALNSKPDFSHHGSPLFAHAPSPEELQILDNHRRRTAADRNALLSQLMEAALPIHLCVIPVPDLIAAATAIATLAEAKKPEWSAVKNIIVWRHPLIDLMELKAPLNRLKIPLHRTEPMDPAADPTQDRIEREHLRSAVTASYIGVTSADLCMADTATLVLRNRPGQPRSVALVPSIHIAVITLDQIISDMKELFALLRWDDRFRSEGLSNYMAFISGPSKTADIEATMVHGAHGPREVYLYVVSGK